MSVSDSENAPAWAKVRVESGTLNELVDNGVAGETKVWVAVVYDVEPTLAVLENVTASPSAEPVSVPPKALSSSNVVPVVAGGSEAGPVSLRPIVSFCGVLLALWTSIDWICNWATPGVGVGPRSLLLYPTTMLVWNVPTAVV